MSIKSIAHLAHQRVASDNGPSIKRTHVYELFAAAFGYGSYAALQAEAVFFADTGQVPVDRPTRITAVKARSQELGYPDPAGDLIATRLCDVLPEQGLDAIRITDLVRSLRGDTHPEEWAEPGDDDPDENDHEDDRPDRHYPWTFGFDESDPDPVLLEGLKSAAERGSALAHYALALIHGDDQYTESDTEARPYWYEQRQAGVVLQGVQVEWADAWERHVTAKQAFEFHLRAAARLRHPEALIDCARFFRDPAVFESGLDLSQQDPGQLADLAASLGRHADAKRWLTVAAEAGDTGAMRTLIEGHDAGDLQRCWLWLYLAELFGTDLTQGHHFAINEYGSEYDDDVGGPAYVAGEDGIELESLPAEADVLARQAAQAIFAKAKRKP